MMMQRSPADVYRRVDLDARIGTAPPAELVALCYEKLLGALGTAIVANDRGDASLKSDSLTRALSAVMALRLGIKGTEGVAGALHSLYEGTSRTILDSVVTFDAPALGRLRNDIREIAAALIERALAA
jgi:flagellin-specific chaperone FliS